jgi:hypothetical protein
MAHGALSTYLSDHLAGATAGAALARRVARGGDGARSGQTLGQVAHDIEADRETLKRLMADLGVRASVVKNTAAWVAERARRLKPNGRFRGAAGMQRLHELEALSLGIAGKQALWEALRAVPQATAFVEIDLDDLYTRACEQRAVVEEARIDAASSALAPAANVVRLPGQVPGL